jgi:hypothetical protein
MQPVTGKLYRHEVVMDRSAPDEGALVAFDRIMQVGR